MRSVFLKYGSFSNINAKLVQAFQQSGILIHERDAFDVVNPKKKPVHGLINILIAFMKFGYRWRIGCEYTPYAFATMTKQCEALLSTLDYDFVFQTQTLFSAYTGPPLKPYFIYTDHTHALTHKAKIHEDKPSIILADEKWIGFEKRTYHKAHIIFAMSDHIRQSLISDYGIPENKVFTVYPGINIKHSNKLRRNYDQKKIIFVGVDFERKGGPILLDAFMQVRSKLPDVELVIVGCKRQVDIPGVTFTGKIDLKQVQIEYQRASIFVLPSVREPFGIAFIEAMANGLPCIGTRIESIPEIIEEGKSGLLVEPNNSEDLANKMYFLLKDSDNLRRMGAKAYAKARNFTWINTAHQILSFIRKKIDNELD